MINIQVVHPYDCDVLIAGGGPAGSALASHLTQKGISVIVIEAQRFPRDKVCGDGVSPIALAELQHIGITGLDGFAEANEINKVGLFIREDKVYIDLEKEDHLPYHARIIPRLQLDNWIHEAALKNGAVYWEDARVTDYFITDNMVVAEVKRNETTVRVKAKVIVGADGSNSTIARILNGSKPSDEYQLLGLRAYYENVNGPRDRVDIFFSDENYPGIYWMFPLGQNEANIGLAMVASTLPKKEVHVKKLLTDHIEKNKCIRERIGNGSIKGKIYGWPLNFFNPANQISSSRLLLVGDAAGLINPLSGDGIQYAVLSARWAAESLLKCFEQNDFSLTALSSYHAKIKEELAYDFALSNLLIQFARNKALTPLWMEIMVVLIERAKVDKSYAHIIASIFEGTYPSYKALTPSFIGKSVLQGGLHIGLNTATGMLQGPEYWMKKGKDISRIAGGIADSIKHNPSGNIKWLSGLLKNGAGVAGHVIKSIRQSN